MEYISALVPHKLKNFFSKLSIQKGLFSSSTSASVRMLCVYEGQVQILSLFPRLRKLVIPHEFHPPGTPATTPKCCHQSGPVQ